jgi:uncharacterized protein (TIGR03545 family)
MTPPGEREAPATGHVAPASERTGSAGPATLETEAAASRDAREPRTNKLRILRPPGLIVFALVVLLTLALWWLYADSLTERGVEATGASLVGARVDVESADVRLSEGSVRLRGLAVANPDAPMRNLLEAEEVVADLVMGPLLSKKVVIQRLSVSGVRFGTERTVSGALENPDPEAGQLWRSVNGWAEQIELPTLALGNLGGVIRTDAIAADSLATVQLARRVVTRADSMRTDWEARIVALDPRPRIDSVQAVAQRLEAFRLTPLTALQVPALVRDGRAALERLTSLRTEIGALETEVRAGITSLAIGPDVLTSLRDQDLAYARGLLDIPTLTAPAISPALFGGTALTWLKPVLYWVQTAERVLPPGLDPKNRPGGRRARAAGTTFEFLEGARYPSFLVQEGDLDLTIAGSGAAAGAYTARVRGLTSSPALLRQPMELELARTQSSQGPRSVMLDAVLDHTGAQLRDSVMLSMAGIGLPEVDLGAVGGSLGLGEGDAELSLLRSGDQIEARLVWRSSQLSWTREGQPVTALAAAPGLPTLRGTAEWARDLIWRTLAGVESVELEMALSGSLQNPSLAVSSNLGDAVAASFQRELGAEIQAAEQRLRQEVDERIQPVVAEARGRLSEVETQVAERLGVQREEVEAVRMRLEARIRELTGVNDLR